MVIVACRTIYNVCNVQRATKTEKYSCSFLLIYGNSAYRIYLGVGHTEVKPSNESKRQLTTGIKRRNKRIDTGPGPGPGPSPSPGIVEEELSLKSLRVWSGWVVNYNCQEVVEEGRRNKGHQGCKSAKSKFQARGMGRRTAWSFCEFGLFDLFGLFGYEVLTSESR